MTYIMIKSTSNRCLNDDPQYFAYYLNKATSNLYSILNEIGSILNSRLDIPKKLTIDRDGSIEGHPVLSRISSFSSNTNERAKISGLRWALLNKHLPFLKTYAYETVCFVGKMNEKEAQKFKQRNPANTMRIKDIIATIPKLKDTVQFTQKELDKDVCITNEVKIVIQLLRHLRNTYSHSYPVQKEQAYLTFIQKLKHNTIEFDVEKDIRKIWNAGILHSSDRVGYIKLRRYRHMIKGLPKNYYHNFRTPENILKQNGIAYLICLFLEKKDAYQFLKKLQGFKQGGAKSKSFDAYTDDKEKQQSERFQATLHTYTAFCCQLPKPVIEFKPGHAAAKIDLMTNMLNELHKCPQELFEMLQTKDQEQFAYSIRQDRLGHIEDNLAAQKTDTTTIATDDLITHAYLIRYRDRFPYFALRFIEEIQLFPAIKFHIDYGKMTLSHTFEDSQGNSTYDHSWTKDVHDFGLLSHAQEHRLNYQLGIQKGIHPQKYIASQYEYFSPHYHIDNNQIQFVLTPVAARIPSRKANDSKKDTADQKFIGKSLVKNNYKERKYIVSTFDLAALIQLKLTTPDFDLQQHLETLETNYLRFLKDAAEGNFEASDYTQFGIKLQAYQLKRHWIPKEIKRCLAKHTVDYQKHLTNKIEAEKEDTKARLDVLNNNNKLNPKIGTMADFLAQDSIKRMLPKSDFKAKITPEQYQQLQRNFALFTTQQIDAFHLLKEELKIVTGKKQNRHPFLYKIIDNSNIKYTKLLDFYKIYLETKGNFLNTLQHPKPVQFSVSNIDKYPFLQFPYETIEDKRQQKTYTVERLQRIYKTTINEQEKNELPFVIPKGFLNELIDAQFSVQNDKTTSVTTENNFVYTMLQTHTDYQVFYDYKRAIRIDKSTIHNPLIGTSKELETKYKKRFKHLLGGKDSQGNRIKGKEITDPKSPDWNKKVWVKRVIQPEKKIRLYKAQDMVLFTMAKYLAEKLEENIAIDSSNWKLSEIRYQDTKKDELHTPSIYEKNILDKECIEVSFEQEGQPKIKTLTNLKKYGKIKTYLRNKRVQELLSWLKDDSIQLEDLQEAIEGLDKLGEKAFSAFLGYEHRCHELGIEHSKRHMLYLEALKEKKLLTTQEVILMNALRNMFCHSGFIDKKKHENYFELIKVQYGIEFNYKLDTVVEVTTQLIEKLYAIEKLNLVNA